MQFQVHDRRAIERGFVVPVAYILISIRDPDKPSVRYRRPSGLRDVLSLAFHDAEPCRRVELPTGIRLMQEEDAAKIWNFVKKHRGSVGAIVCHCEQGMSRSPAVALALADAFGEEHEAERIRLDSQPNQYIYDLLRKAIQADGESDAGLAET
jgi:predicted protein tyrosine phosphatase